MGYIGNEPTTGHFPVDNFTSSGGSTYTLAKAPASAGAIEVSVQGVLQPTTAYTVSGTTLTMAGVTTGVKIFVRHLGETLTLPTPADGSVTTAKLGINSVDGTKIAMGSDAQGDILYHGATDYARLAKGTAGQALVMNSGATAPEWGSGLPTAGADGQVLTSDGTNWASEALASSGFTRGTEYATTSGTGVTHSSIPAGTSIIHVLLNNVSLSTTANLNLQLGDAGGIETTGYLSTSDRTGNNLATSTTAFMFELAYADAALAGVMTLARVNTSHDWVASFAGRVKTSFNVYVGGWKSLSAELTQVKISPVSGNFDAGSTQILYM